MNGDRETILNALRQRDQPDGDRLKHSIRESPVRSGIRDEDLVRVLGSSLELLGGHFHRAGSEEEVREILSRLIRAGGMRKLAVLSDDYLGKIGIDRLVRDLDVELFSYSEAEIGHTREEVTADLKDADMGVFPVFRALAQSGTMVIKGNAGLKRAVSLIPPVIVGIMDKERVVADLGDVFSELIDGKALPSEPGDWMVCISGPSRTADIEATLTTGIHGPGEAHLIVRV